MIARIAIIALASLAAATAGAQEQYKRITRDAIADVVDGELDKAEADLSAYQGEHPGDLESMFGLAVVYAQRGDVDEAMEFVRESVRLGLPPERYVAGPRDLLKPLTESDAFRQFIRNYPMPLLHGPVTGAVTDRSARVWARAPGESAIQVLTAKNAGMASASASPPVQTKAEDDFTAVASFGNLDPDTRYYYRIRVDGELVPGQWSFNTFPEAGAPARFAVGFGGGAGYTPQHERMWDTIRGHGLDAFFLLGDNVYIDNPTRPAVQDYCYYRRQSRPEYRRFASETSVFAIWDDHDFTTNDERGGPAIGEPAWKIPVWNKFKDNWNNPYYAGGESQPGCWFDTSIADVDFFLLDGRYYKTAPDADHPSMLGPAQKEWLFEKLRGSDATFKVLASPVPWAFGSKPGSLDPWQGYREERGEIFTFLSDNRIEGVILISADRHRSDAWKIEREDGYALYEFESSRLTNIHTHGIMPESLFGYNKKCSFGILRFDTEKPDPEVTYEIRSIDNETIHTLTVKRSELSH